VLRAEKAVEERPRYFLKRSTRAARENDPRCAAKFRRRSQSARHIGAMHCGKLAITINFA
jgi:hypothetical protein